MTIKISHLPVCYQSGGGVSECLCKMYSLGSFFVFSTKDERSQLIKGVFLFEIL